MGHKKFFSVKSKFFPLKRTFGNLIREIFSVPPNSVPSLRPCCSEYYGLAHRIQILQPSIFNEVGTSGSSLLLLLIITTVSFRSTFTTLDPSDE